MYWSSSDILKYRTLTNVYIHYGTHIDKYILYLYIDAAGPVAREKQWTTMSHRVIVHVAYTSGQALER